MTEREKLVYFSGDEIVYSTNTFINVPVILQYDDTPLIEVKKSLKGSVNEMVFSVHDESGDKLAVIRGVRVFPTEAGKTAGWDLRQEPNLVACQVDGRTILEVRRTLPARLATMAELYTPDGKFLKASANEYIEGFAGDQPWQIGGVTMMNNTFKNLAVGVKISSSGTVSIGGIG